MNAYCRLCSKSEDTLINIFDDVGIERNISEKINQRLQIFVDEEDILSNTICFNCYGKLEIFDAFVKNVHRMQTYLTKQVSIKCEKNLIETAVEPHSTISNSSICNRTLVIMKHDSEQNILKPKITESECKDQGKSAQNFEAIASSEIRKEIATNTSDNENYKKEIEVLDVLKKCSTYSNNNSEQANQNKTRKKRRYFEMLDSEDKVTTRRSVKRLSSSEEKPDFKADVKRKKRMSKKVKNANSSVEVLEKKDFHIQAGNTLFSDLKNLKNSLILKRAPTKNAIVLCMYPSSNSYRDHFPDTDADKGCQVEVLLEVRSSTEKIPTEYRSAALEGKSLSDVKFKNIITSPLDV